MIPHVICQNVWNNRIEKCILSFLTCSMWDHHNFARAMAQLRLDTAATWTFNAKMKENTTVQTKRKLKCAWKVQCNCGIIYNFESCREKKPNKKKHANTIDECIPVIWDGQCFQLNGTMKEMHSSLCSRLMVFRFRFWSY